LKTSISKAALSSGLLVFIILLIFLFSRAGDFFFLAIYVAPGLVYGLALTASANNPVSAVRGMIFVLLSVVINFGCVYFVCQDFLDLDPGYIAPLKLVICGGIGAVLLTSSYDLLLVRLFSVFRTIAVPSILGIGASLFSAFFMYLLDSGNYNKFVTTILWVGMLAVLPLWQYLIGLNLAFHGKSIYSTKLSKTSGRPDQESRVD
jgi:hypothetical protein